MWRLKAKAGRVMTVTVKTGQGLGVQVVIYRRFGQVSQLLNWDWWTQLKTHKDLSCKHTNKNLSLSRVALIYRGNPARWNWQTLYTDIYMTPEVPCTPVLIVAQPQQWLPINEFFLNLVKISREKSSICGENFKTKFKLAPLNMPWSQMQVNSCFPWCCGSRWLLSQELLAKRIRKQHPHPHSFLKHTGVSSWILFAGSHLPAEDLIVIWEGTSPDMQPSVPGRNLEM